MSIIGDLKTGSISETIVLFAALGMLYGGVHAASWNGHYPSHLERTMCRIAACSVAGGGFVIWPLYALSLMIARSLSHQRITSRDSIVVATAVAGALVEPFGLTLDQTEALRMLGKGNSVESPSLVPLLHLARRLYFWIDSLRFSSIFGDRGVYQPA